MELSHLNLLIPLNEKSHLLHNTISQRSLKLSTEESHQYKLCQSESSQISSLDFNLFQKLSSIRAICKSANDQISSLHLADKELKSSNDKLLLTIMMTESCNFSCQYCNQGHNKKPLHISNSLISNVQSYISALTPSPSSIEINWFGGEPLIRAESIIEASTSIQSFSQSSNISYVSSIATNGFLLTGDLSKRLHEAGVYLFQISIDGNRADHDNSRFIKDGHSSYDVIIDNISRSLSICDSKILIRVNVDHRNVHNLKDLVDDLHLRHILTDPKFSIYFSHIYDPSLNSLGDDQGMANHLLTPMQFADYQFELNNYVLKKSGNVAVDLPTYQGSCIASHTNSFAIHANGDLFKCYIPISNKEESFGTLSSNGFLDFNREVFERWDSWSPFDSPYCSGCKLLGSCRGACRFNFVSSNYAEEEFKCPPSKLYAHEYIFSKAISKGIVNSTDWDPDSSHTILPSLRFK